MGETRYLVLILYFLLFSLLGWILDSTYCSIVRKRLVSSGYFRGLPLCSIYGVGGVALLLTVHYLGHWPWLALIIGAVILSAVEYLGGVFCVTVLKERLWDYSHHKLNLQGHIDFLHSFFWLFLTAAFIFVLYPDFIRFNSFLNNVINFPKSVDRAVLILFLTVAVIFTAQRRAKRLKGKK